MTKRVQDNRVRGPMPVGRRMVKGNAGRPKGAPNRVTREIREAIMGGAELAGDDIAKERGWKHGGLLAYFHNLAEVEPVAMSACLRQCLPKDVKVGMEGLVAIRVVTGVPPEIGEPGEN